MGLPLIGESLADAGLYMLGIYVTLRHNTMAQYIATQTIFDIAVEEDQRTSSPEQFW